MSFELPSQAQQGGTHWYAIELAFEWEGRPAPGERAYLVATWNGLAAFQLKVQQSAELGPGQVLEWSLVDEVTGGTRGLELARQFSGRASNYAQVAAVRPGRNDISIAVRAESTTGKKPIHVTISRSSAIVVTRVGPPWVEAEDIQVSLTETGIDVQAEFANRGLAASDLVAVLAVVYSDGTWETFHERIGRIPTLGTTNYRWNQSLPDKTVEKVSLATAYATGGRPPVVIWPTRHSNETSRLIQVAASPTALLLAFISAWLAIPYALGRVDR